MHTLFHLLFARTFFFQSWLHLSGTRAFLQQNAEVLAFFGGVITVMITAVYFTANAAMRYADLEKLVVAQEKLFESKLASHKDELTSREKLFESKLASHKDELASREKLFESKLASQEFKLASQEKLFEIKLAAEKELRAAEGRLLASPKRWWSW